MAKMWISFFEILCISFITDQPIFCLQIVFHVLSTLIPLKLQIEVKMKNSLIYGFNGDRS